VQSGDWFFTCRTAAAGAFLIVAAGVVDRAPSAQNLPPTLVDVTGHVSFTTSPLHPNNKGKDKGPFSGSVTLSNTGSIPFAAPLQVEFDGLTPGVILVNAAGTRDGAPFLASGISLAPAASLTLPVVFSVGDTPGGDNGQGKDQGGGNDEKLVVYTVKVFSGAF